MKLEKYVQPSRLLNDPRGFLGLTLIDLAAGVFVFMSVSLLLDESGWALISIPMAILFLIALSPIRLTTRRKIIRDTLTWLISRRVLHDPRR